ncbi:hypothetical protein J6590_047106 [Homalodisca vitripennis]|nr:hypothetical protein J6590_047106 [Homalodisca vitripennis]
MMVQEINEEKKNNSMSSEECMPVHCLEGVATIASPLELHLPKAVTSLIRGCYRDILRVASTKALTTAPNRARFSIALLFTDRTETFSNLSDSDQNFAGAPRENLCKRWGCVWGWRNAVSVACLLSCHRDISTGRQLVPEITSPTPPFQRAAVSIPSITCNITLITIN